MKYAVDWKILGISLIAGIFIYFRELDYYRSIPRHSLLAALIIVELFVYYQLAPEILETFVTVIVPMIIQFFVYSNYFSLRMDFE